MAQSEGLCSKGIKLYYGSGDPIVYTLIDDVQEIPDLGGTTDSLEVTTLADSQHRYINGLKNLGDSLDFVMLFTKAQFNTINQFGDTVKDWKVEFPTETSSTTYACTFKGACSIKTNSVGTNGVIQATISIKPNSTMTWA